jgi:homoserine dehydrogenase
VEFVVLVFGCGDVGGFWAEIVKECTREELEADADIALFYTNSEGKFYQSAEEAVEIARKWAEDKNLTVVDHIKYDKEI